MTSWRVLTQWIAFYVLLLLVAWSAPMALAGSRPVGNSVSGMPLDRYIHEVEKSYHDVRSLRADFTQTYSSGGRTRVESGVVVFARGGRMRWDYQQPEKKLFLSDGKNVFLYIPGEKQVNRSSVKSSEDFRIPFRLLLSRLNLRKYFSKIADAPEALEKPAADRVLRGIPKGGKDRPYQQVLIEFDPQMNIRRLVIFYNNYSKMEFSFERITRNPLLGASTFRFQIPPGAEVINTE